MAFSFINIHNYMQVVVFFFFNLWSLSTTTSVHSTFILHFFFTNFSSSFLLNVF